MKKFVYILVLLWLPGHWLQAQVVQVRSTTSNGASWLSGGVYTQFGVAGQYSVSNTLQGGNFTGNAGFLYYQNPQQAQNQAPVALGDSANFYLDMAGTLELKGYDQENDTIEYIVTLPPAQLNSSAGGAYNQLLSFSPKAGLLPGTVYQDSLKFKVKEVATGVFSNEATVLFQFMLDDTPHYILALDRVTNQFTVQFIDTVKNASYILDINYYDLSDIANPVFVPIIQSEIQLADFTGTNDTLAYTFSVDETVHSYLFSANQVFTTVLVTSNTGFSDFAAYMLDNSGAGRVSGSADGQFWVMGSEQTVPEGETVNLNMMAVEFTDADLTNATIEILSQPNHGQVGHVVQIEMQPNLITWEIPYTSTGETGGLDSLLFRVFHPGRNEFDSTYTVVEIINVNDPPEIDEVFDKQVLEDEVLTFTIPFNDPDNEVGISVASSDDSKVQVFTTNNELTISPALNFTGEATITITVKELNTDELFAAVESFSVEVLPVNDAPTMNAIANQVINEDTNLQLVLSALDVDNELQQFDFLATIDNPGIAQASITGNVLNIVPAKDANGTITVSVTADDKSGAPNATSEPLEFTVDITPVNDAPEVINALATQVLVQDFPGYDIDLSTVFADAETAVTDLQYSVANNSNIQVAIAGTTATITVVGGFSGSEDVTFSASDGAITTDMLVSFVVTPMSSDIVVNNAPGTINVNEDFGNYVLDVSNVFKDNSNANADFNFDIAGSTVLDYVIDNTANTITFTSQPNIAGTETLLLIGTTNGSAAYTNLTIEVAAVNDAPQIAAIANQQIAEDGKLENLFLAITDVDNTLDELSVTAASTNQSILLSSNVQVTQLNGYYYVTALPEPNMFGNVDIILEVSDGNLASNTTFTLNITSVNDMPETTGAGISTALEDEVFNFNLATLVTDADGDALAFSMVGAPDWLTLTNGELSGTPKNEDVGNYTLQIIADDGVNQLNKSFSFSVINVNDTPIVAVPQADKTLLQENTFEYLFPTSAFTDVDAGDELTYKVEKCPGWAILSGTSLSGIPQYEDIGKDTIILKATDKAGLFATDTVIVTVEFTTYDVVVEVPGATICEGETATLTATGAVDYNWYDVSANLLQAGGNTFDYAGLTSADILVEGVDAQGRATPDKTTVSVVVNPLPDVILSQTDGSITVPATNGASYQWYNNNGFIQDATQNAYTPTESGNYYVEVTSGEGCVAISETIEMLILGIDDWEAELQVYPVPTHDVLHIKGVQQVAGLSVKVVDVKGKQLEIPVTKKADELILHTGLLKNGVYVLQMTSLVSTKMVRFIKR